MSLAATASTEPDLVPALDEVAPQLNGITAATRALASYIDSLGQINTERRTIVENGLTILLPNPFEGSPEALAAVQRAQGRTGEYNKGRVQYSNWLLGMMMYSYNFSPTADRLAQIYDQTAPSGPTPSQREEVKKCFASLINPLERDRQVLAGSAEAFLAVRTFLNEDKNSIGQGAPVLDRAIQRFEENFHRLLLRYTLDPTTRGLVPILTKAGNYQLTHLRTTQATIAEAVADCDRAFTAVSSLSGHLLNLVNKYRGTEQLLNQAQGAAFKTAMQNIKFSMARDRWASFQAYLMKYLGGNG
jgi:hypothetical protein